MKSNLEQTQSILYIGYVLLVFLGIINETLFYSQFGINILEYSDILDVLLSPISKLTSNVKLLIISLFVVMIIITLPAQIGKMKHKKWIVKAFKLKEEDTDVEKKILNMLTLFSIIFFVGIFVGAGIGKGKRLKVKMESGKLQYKDTIHFMDGEKENVEIIGKNSSYVFYIHKLNPTINITPINGTIKSLVIE